MKKAFLVLATLLLAASQPLLAQSAQMNFFVTSAGPGNGADLGGLEGADAHCYSLAYAIGAGDLSWRAYLSTTAANGEPVVNARDRIGEGPWYNHGGVEVAANLDELHGDNSLNKETALTEEGQQVNGRDDDPNQHDILTGSLPDGTASAEDGDTTCNNWTSDGEGSALLGHVDRQGGGDNPTSWNSSHGSRGCGQEDLIGTGGNGYFYCFGIGA
ncbi:MAG: hypothetical protein GEU90_01505 [Gemmatimonas sp.]|nr:hypothetical protein [Gemmatimonas sp.]